MRELRVTAGTVRGGVRLFISGSGEQLPVGVEGAGGVMDTLGEDKVTHGGAMVEADGGGGLKSRGEFRVACASWC